MPTCTNRRMRRRQRPPFDTKHLCDVTKFYPFFSFLLLSFPTAYSLLDLLVFFLYFFFLAYFLISLTCVRRQHLPMRHRGNICSDVSTVLELNYNNGPQVTTMPGATLYRPSFCPRSLEWRPAMFNLLTAGCHFFLSLIHSFFLDVFLWLDGSPTTRTFNAKQN